jgi:hypothetical protein
MDRLKAGAPSSYFSGVHLDGRLDGCRSFFEGRIRRIHGEKTSIFKVLVSNVQWHAADFPGRTIHDNGNTSNFPPTKTGTGLGMKRWGSAVKPADPRIASAGTWMAAR